jgi:pantothenate kinase-related protein Tda10
MCRFDKKLTFRDFQDRMDQTKKLIREKYGPPYVSHDFPTFLTGMPKELPTAVLNEIINEQSEIPLSSYPHSVYEYGVDRQTEQSQKEEGGG